MRKYCPHQSINSHSCSVPNALNMVHPSGLMEFKVNATSEIGSTTSRIFEYELNLISKIFL